MRKKRSNLRASHRARLEILVAMIIALSCFLCSANIRAELHPAQIQAIQELQLVRLGHSSTSIPKAYYDEYKKAGRLPHMVYLFGIISGADIPIFKDLLAPYLDPKYFKTHKMPSWFSGDPDESRFIVVVDSEGGAVLAALELGRMFRKARVTIWVPGNMKCLSSCAFLLAGAVRRTLYEGSEIGIHRPYSEETAPTTFESAQNRANLMRDLVSKYMKEMNMPDALYDEMLRVPSDQIKILDAKELVKYGLAQDDPVFAELNLQAWARAAGISVGEYMARKREFDDCYAGIVNRTANQRGDSSSPSAELQSVLDGRRQCLDRYIFKK